MSCTNFLVRVIWQYSMRHTLQDLITRTHEHLNFNSITKSAVKDIYHCFNCNKKCLSVSDFYKKMSEKNLGPNAQTPITLNSGLVKVFNSRRIHCRG